MPADVDLLMITYNRASHTRVTLPHLLDHVDENTRVWLWHNGNDEETLSIAREIADDPRVHKFHHSPQNVKLREPTNWLYTNSKGSFLAKVDDDCLMPAGWLTRLREAHAAVPKFGVLGCWHFQDEDFDSALAGNKIQQIDANHRLLRNPWVGGSGYLMKRACVEQAGPLRDAENESFTDYCIRLALAGWINGWPYPLLKQEHLDDPRSPNSMIRNDADLRRFGPLSAQQFGADSFRQWDQQLRRSARTVQTCPWDAKHYVGWRGRLRRINQRVRRSLGK